MSRHPRIVLPLAFAALLLVQVQAEAQVKPFKISGGGLAPNGLSLIPGVAAPHWSVGVATELGAHTGQGFFQLLDYTSPLTAEFSTAPCYIFIAANGDQLAVTYGDVNNGAKGPGEVTLTPHPDGSLSAVFVAEFNPIPSKSTGRFAKIKSGSFIMIARSEPFFIQGAGTTPFFYSWVGSGTMTYGK